MKGYKGFKKGLICKGKQYAENTVFEESKANICKNGMHFCENPLDVLDYYPLIDDNGELNEFAEVEALADVKTDDNKKFCTTKLKIGAKIAIAKLGEISAEFLREKITKETGGKNGGDWAQQVGGNSAKQVGGNSAQQVGGDSAQQVGGNSAQQVGGDWAKQVGGNSAKHVGGDSAQQVGGYSAQQVGGNSAQQVGGDSAQQESGNNSVMVAGENSKFKSGLNSLIVTYWYDDKGDIAGYKVAQVDGDKIKADTWYKLENGEFVEVSDES